MIEVVIDSIRVSLISQQRIVMLRELDGERQMPIWIGPCEAEAIEIRLRETTVARPMTHDLLKIVLEELGGALHHIVVNDLIDGTFKALLFIDTDGGMIEVDCRPSDAIALAVRADVAIYVEETVMDEVGILPEPDIADEPDGETPPNDEDNDTASEGLDAFRSFLDNLDDE